MEDTQFQEFLTDAFKSALTGLKDGGSFYIWHADFEGYNFRAAAKRAGLTIRQCLIWVKNALVLGRQDYQWRHEPCLYGWKDGASHYFIDDRSLDTVIDDKVNLNRLSKNELKEMLSNILTQGQANTIIYENKPTKNAEHPTMKPVRLMARLILNSTRKGENVLDPFGGSGSTLVAAHQMGRCAYLMELDPKYCDVIVDRYEKLTGQKAVLLSDN